MSDSPEIHEVIALRQQLAERHVRIAKLEMDTVPRSRYNACNQDWLDAEATLKIVRASAQQEIERLTQDVIAWEHDYRELQEKLAAMTAELASYRAQNFGA